MIILFFKIENNFLFFCLKFIFILNDLNLNLPILEFFQLFDLECLNLKLFKY